MWQSPQGPGWESNLCVSSQTLLPSNEARATTPNYILIPFSHPAPSVWAYQNNRHHSGLRVVPQRNNTFLTRLKECKPSLERGITASRWNSLRFSKAPIISQIKGRSVQEKLQLICPEISVFWRRGLECLPPWTFQMVLVKGTREEQRGGERESHVHGENIWFQIETIAMPVLPFLALSMES